MDFTNNKSENTKCDSNKKELKDSFIQTNNRRNKLKMRIVDLNEPESNYTFFQNKIKNQKYNILTFFPVVLLNQFSFFSNQFYLLMVISQFFDSLKVGFLFSYVAPLVFVLFVTLFKEAMDDIFRFKQDKFTNQQEYTIILSDKKGGVTKHKIKCEDIKIGDILEINQNERIPADLVILKTFEESGSVFIRTDQLDGETDWKLRKSPSYTQSIETLEGLLELKGHLEYDAPSRMIYEFTGVLNIFDNYNENNTEINGKGNLNNNMNNYIKEPLSLENTMWASTILASKKAIAVVIYTGKEARFQMNSSNPKTKKGALDLELNNLSKILFFIMVISAIVITIMKGFKTNLILMLLDFFRFIILFSAIIPISLAVNLDISKAVNSSRINKDPTIPETIARNSTIPEELGRIEYIFSDKTGTLTKNEMLFKKLAMENDIFGLESFNDIKMILEDECKKFDSSAMDLIQVINFSDKINSNSINYENLSINESIISRDYSNSNTSRTNPNTSKRIRRNRNKVIRDTIAAMALCNNVTPITEDNEDENSHEIKKENIKINSSQNKNPNLLNEMEYDMNIQRNLEDEIDKEEDAINKFQNSNKINYQASSPDEVALVKTAEELNMTLVFRNDREIKIKNANNVIEEYEVLANFPFSSDTKRMGILLRNKKHRHIIFYMKGAESVMEKFVKQEYRGYIRENAENLACIGLRTLVLAQKVISEEFYQHWATEYTEARTTLDDRNEKISRCLSKLEEKMDFLTVTGVEDLLQDDVCNTIESLRNAGIKIWMLTGDKVETATCISISAGLKSKSDKLFYIRDKSKEKDYVVNELKILNFTIHQTVLIIDGDCLEVALNFHEKEFFETVMKAPAVVCCRCSPTQKARITKQIKNYTTKRTCSIGDGGNDVAMIQQADIGVGLVGKEGLQASLAADFSITKFKHLSHLLLWLGRLSYKNTATISKFVIHRGLIISLIQFIFSIIFYNMAFPIYNGMLILGYSSIYTNLPVISLLLDQDTKVSSVMKFPTLYKNLLKGRELSIKSFLWWLWKSIFQASVIMIGAILMFDKIYLKIATVSFTVLIFAELLNVYSEIKTFHRYMTFSILGTLFTYLFSLIFFKSILDVYLIFDIVTIGKTLFLAIISWLPFYIYYIFKYKCYPEDTDKLNLIEINQDMVTYI